MGREGQRQAMLSVVTQLGRKPHSVSMPYTNIQTTHANIHIYIHTNTYNTYKHMHTTHINTQNTQHVYTQHTST